jgi:hypothetical protein
VVSDVISMVSLVFGRYFNSDINRGRYFDGFNSSASVMVQHQKSILRYKNIIA